MVPYRLEINYLSSVIAVTESLIVGNAHAKGCHGPCRGICAEADSSAGFCEAVGKRNEKITSKVVPDIGRGTTRKDVQKRGYCPRFG